MQKAVEDEFYQRMQKDKDGQFYLNMLKQGTMSDRIAALSAIIQREPRSSLVPWLPSEPGRHVQKEE